MKIVRSALAIALSLVLAVSFIGCKKDPNSGVAATISGLEVKESDITAMLEFYRTDQTTKAVRDDAAWASLLASKQVPDEWREFFKAKGYTETTFTPEIFREYTIRSKYGVYRLIVQKAAELGITVDQANLDIQMEAIASSAKSAGVTTEQYIQQGLGFANESLYRMVLEANQVSTPLLEAVLGTPTEEEINEYISTHASEYVGKRFSIIFDAVDEDTTEEQARENMTAAKAKLDQGVDFATVAQETIPEDEAYAGIKAAGGDIGWGQELYLPAELTAAIAALDIDQPSNVVEVRTDTMGTTDDTSDDNVSAIYIIKYTDTFALPEGTTSNDGTNAAGDGSGSNTANDASGTGSDVSGTDEGTTKVDIALIPESLKAQLTDEAKQAHLSEKQNDYWLSLMQSDLIVVNPMPEGLSYDVDMTLATPIVDTSVIDSTEAVASAEAAGLVTTDAVVGSGAEAKEGDTLEVYYSGSYTNGTIFDSNISSGTPITVVLGETAVIEGWQQGLLGMKVGGKRTLTIPPSLGYGDKAHNEIPANTILVFQVELVSVNGDSTGYTSGSITAGIDSGETVIE